VQDALDVAAASRTTVCVAHRLSTIRNADNIIVLSKGEVVEQGTHSELFALNGMYRKLVETQNITTEGSERQEEKLSHSISADETSVLELTKTITHEMEKLKDSAPPNYSNFRLFIRVTASCFPR
jgi:ATP-binding cassette, subfamily B (MDR/TAP), member 1